MQFLKTLFWVIIAVVLVLFSASNWHRIEVKLWQDLLVEINLPLLVIGAFLLGFLPTWILYRARLWSLKRRLEGQTTAHVANAPAVMVRNPSATPQPAEPTEI